MKKAPGFPLGPSALSAGVAAARLGLCQASVTVLTVEIQAVATGAFAKQ
ncbi:hypothetical protein QMO56_21580 [Roseomonas sp. E05]|nr:hypothetical protein [Roseomonas sp. E05]MDJ0390711.1 hypothetical protein [Roseomonas sp. E05]